MHMDINSKDVATLVSIASSCYKSFCAVKFPDSSVSQHGRSFSFQYICRL